jgi:hypothetical protein
MDASALTALAALCGAAIGGLTSVCANLLTQRMQVRAHWLAREMDRRQDLYKDFIEQASRCYVHALQHGEPDVAGLVALYAKLGRMRLISSPTVLESAGAIERNIIDTYLMPDKSFLELREMINSGSVDLLRDFSTACRAEFELLNGR